jgi:hypothetical protein
LREREIGMRIVINPVMDMETLKWVSNSGSYEYAGPMVLACSSGGKVAVDDQALQDATLASVKQQTADYGTTFAEQQQVLNSIKTRMQAEATNPMGYTPAQLAIQRTSINENFSNAAKQALGSAAAFAAAHGSSDIGGGATGQIAGQIGTAAATGAAQARASLAQQNEALKQENRWKALSGLDTVGAQYGGAGATAIGNVAGVSNASTGAGEGVTQAKQAGWQDVSGVLSGISGLATAGVNAWTHATPPATSYGLDIVKDKR